MGDRENGQKKSDKGDVKHVADIVGEWGKWQLNFHTYLTILWAAVSLNNVGYGFFGFNNKHWCSDVPQEIRTDHYKCHSIVNETCDDWQYDRSVFYNSITTQFDLVCGRSHFAAMTQAAFGIGYLFSGTVLAHYSDRYGRLPIVWIGSIIDIAGILIASIAPNVYIYTIGRFLSGFGHSGKGMAIYTIQLEICGPKHRSDIVMLTGTGWVFGYVIIPALGYWLQDYRYLHVASLISMLILLVWLYFLDESPRWQLCNGQIDKAEKTLRKALRMNGMSDEGLEDQMKHLIAHLEREQNEQIKLKKYSLLDLFRTTNIRKRILVLWYLYACNALVYYAFTYNIGDFGGNFYITFMLSGLIELPSQLLCAFLLRFVGRRPLLISFMALTSVSCLINIFVPWEWLKVCLALSGKFGTNGSWSLMSLLGLETFPTVLRHIAMGSTSVVSRVGSISAPYMRNLSDMFGLAPLLVLYSSISGVGALLTMILPETRNKEIPDTIEEAEKDSVELQDVSNDK